ncbi:hypothetical protein K438DRAFT_1938761 [Mycena galopus ATCC 62051]|nr:hypothetical protein K438DRAFT_1938761 [Mycena galopus ATCC 62051]
MTPFPCWRYASKLHGHPMRTTQRRAPILLGGSLPPSPDDRMMHARRLMIYPPLRVAIWTRSNLGRRIAVCAAADVESGEAAWERRILQFIRKSLRARGKLHPTPSGEVYAEFRARWGPCRAFGGACLDGQGWRGTRVRSPTALSVNYPLVPRAALPDPASGPCSLFISLLHLPQLDALGPGSESGVRKRSSLPRGRALSMLIPVCQVLYIQLSIPPKVRSFIFPPETWVTWVADYPRSAAGGEKNTESDS